MKIPELLESNTFFPALTIPILSLCRVPALHSPFFNAVRIVPAIQISSIGSIQIESFSSF
ncbi:MAG: hypothetical protein WDA18_01700 [Candidatus Ratteibacteria bacterium]